jgi:hypothetical protein
MLSINKENMQDTLRIWRSPKSAFGHFTAVLNSSQEETVTALDAYSDEELAKIAKSGFNAIWVHANLNQVVRTRVFPELGKDAELHQQRINALIERAQPHNLKVILFCQPGRAIPCQNEFWQHHPDVAGQRETLQGCTGEDIHLYSLCTSTEKVKKYLYQAAAELAGKVPKLGGIIMITASELPSHCWGRRGNIMLADGNFAYAAMECPRCAQRKPEAVVNEVIQLMRDGIRSVSAAWKIIAWNWSWSFYLPPPCTDIIAALPKDVTLMVDFERGGRKIIAGKERVMDEYSLGFAGPSEQFMRSLEVARDNHIPVMAKLQFGTTHEMATVPNIPVLGNVYAKATAVRQLQLSGFMGCWNFGNMITANTAGFNAFLAGRLPEERDEALQAFAAEYFPGCNAAQVTTAWLTFGTAMDSYPFSTPFLYSGPPNFAFILPMQPAPLTEKTVGRSWLDDERGDNMSSAISGYTIEEIIACLEQLTKTWTDGLTMLREALAGCTHPHITEELNTATVCCRAFRSAANFCKVFRLRRQWNDKLLPEYRAIISDEMDNLLKVLPLVQADKRFGYHIEAHAYQYDADGIAAKISELKRQLA